LVGAVFTLVGVIAGLWHPPHLYTSGFCVSVGSSIIAAAIVNSLSPINQEAFYKFLSLGIEDVYPSRGDVEPRQWVRWLRRARRSCVLLGIAHGNWRRDEDFEGALIERLRNNVEVKIIFLDPTCTIANVRAKEDKRRDTKHDIRTSIQILWRIRQSLPPELRPRLRLFVYEATPSLGLTWIDETFMVATHYLAGSTNLTSPALLLEPGRSQNESLGLYDVYARNLQSIEQEFSTEITEENVNVYLPEEQL
jgi:hypothetical protein